MRYIGASNFSAEQIEEADAVARDRGFARFTAIQNNYSLLVRDADREVLPDVRAARARIRAVLPAGVGIAHGQVPARRAGADRHAAGRTDRVAHR